jgi:hypothetical protein
MMFIAPRLKFFFGDARTAYPPFFGNDCTSIEQLIAREPFATIARELAVQKLVVLHQTHSVHGFGVTHNDVSLLTQAAYAREGDFLMTDLPGIALGVSTADCVPLVIYDPEHHAVSVIHAGWRGSVAGIARHALEAMRTQWRTDPEKVQIIVGPSAKTCCYEVQPTIKHDLGAYADHVVLMRDGKFYLDVPRISMLQLQGLGVQESQWDFSHIVCTICSPQHCSYRRDGAQALRQMTCVTLCD